MLLTCTVLEHAIPVGFVCTSIMYLGIEMEGGQEWAKRSSGSVIKRGAKLPKGGLVLLIILSFKTAKLAPNFVHMARAHGPQHHSIQCVWAVQVTWSFCRLHYPRPTRKPNSQRCDFPCIAETQVRIGHDQGASIKCPSLSKRVQAMPTCTSVNTVHLRIISTKQLRIHEWYGIEEYR